MPTAASSLRHLRSLLYVPADRPRMLGKIAGLAADASIIDLEDAVAPEAKADARRHAAAFFDGSAGGRPAFLRVNALESGLGADDLVLAARLRPAGVILPKVSFARDIEQAGALLAEAGGGDVSLLAMIESPMAVLNLREIAGAAPGRLAGLVAGTNDLAKDMGIEDGGTPAGGGRRHLAAPLVQIVIAARAFGLAAFDGVMNRIGDEAALAAECAEARAMGFDGKTLIHPAQIAAANAAFAPGEAELARARMIVAAFERPEHAASGAIRLDGEMVERLHLERAKALLARAR